jgi:signal transduction histidine kinase
VKRSIPQDVAAQGASQILASIQALVHRRLSPTQRVWGIGAVLVLVTVICAGLTIWDLYRRTSTSISEHMANLGLVLAEQTSRYVQVVDLLLQELQSHSRDLRIQTPEEFKQRLGGQDTHNLLRERMVNLPQANALVIVDADGRVLNTSRKWPAERLDISDSDGYAHFKANDDNKLFVSKPLKNRITGNWTVYLVRRVSGPDGVFLGTVAGALDVKYLADFYSTISANQGVHVTLLRRDGTMLARYPDMDRYVGRTLGAGSLWYGQVAGGGGSYTSPGLRSGVPSIVSVNPLVRYPLVMDVAMPRSDAMAGWRRQAVYVAAGESIAAVAFIMLFRIIGRQFRRQETQNAELQRTAEAARTNELRLRDFAEMASDWLWEQDAELRFVSITAGSPMIGPDDKPYVGKRRWEMVDHDTDDERWRTHKADLAARRPFRDFCYERIGSDGKLHHNSINGNPVFDRDGRFTGYRGTGRDITQDIAAAAALRQAKEQAEAANGAKSEFLANMSHELRTPLHAIIGFAELIRDHPFDPKDARCADYARDIHASGRHLLDLINDVLDMSKIEMGHYTLNEENVDLQDVVRACANMLALRAMEGRVAVSRGEFACVHLRADRRALKQVMLNLLTNAVKFTPPGGRVRVGASLATDGGLVAVVADTGVGIGEAALPNLCEPFYQADASSSRSHGGTGLGLAICNKLVKLHGGSLRIESQRGLGTVVSVRFPRERVVRPARMRRELT